MNCVLTLHGCLDLVTRVTNGPQLRSAGINTEKSCSLSFCWYIENKQQRSVYQPSADGGDSSFKPTGSNQKKRHLEWKILLDGRTSAIGNILVFSSTKLSLWKRVFRSFRMRRPRSCCWSQPVRWRQQSYYGVIQGPEEPRCPLWGLQLGLC